MHYRSRLRQYKNLKHQMYNLIYLYAIVYLSLFDYLKKVFIFFTRYFKLNKEKKM